MLTNKLYDTQIHIYPKNRERERENKKFTLHSSNNI